MSTPAPIVPWRRPLQPRSHTTAILSDGGVDTRRPALLGIRGYYRDTMGQPGSNDIGIYDDAIFLWSPEIYAAYNANTDPSRQVAGRATLKTGLWWYALGIHGLSRPPAQRYEALVQAQTVTVERWQRGPDTGWFGINIHRGGWSGTSSEGCQTIHPDQWLPFFESVKDQMRRHSVTRIPYLLIEQTL